VRWTLLTVILVVCAVLYVLARVHDRRARERWLDERVSERDWKALEHFRWHTEDDILLLAPRPLPEPLERQYRAALRSGEHTESMDHRRR
jgi:hypothetical protein